MGILKNLKWLLTAPPTSITQTKSSSTCDYCGNDEGITNYIDEGFSVCNKCRKKVFDQVLGHEIQNKEE